jgi:uncharacterized membrane protein
MKAMLRRLTPAAVVASIFACAVVILCMAAAWSAISGKTEAVREITALVGTLIAVVGAMLADPRQSPHVDSLPAQFVTGTLRSASDRDGVA